MRIYLIGFMGTGKTTLGENVARSLNVPFFDTDQMIEEQIGMAVTEIFSSRGEDSFREIEARVIRSTDIYDKAIIATGGGLPVYYHNMDWLLDHGITMYLQWPEDILVASLVQHRSIRPLLADLTVEEATSKALALLEERRPVYERSSMTVTLTGNIETDIKILEKACKYIF
jgi:shikimate kinase